MSTLYLYRMSADTGNAPCAYDKDFKPLPLLSLACCKGGRIRAGNPVRSGLRRAIGTGYPELGEVWLSALYNKTKILYIANITSVVRMQEYFSNPTYKNRMDQIYDVSESEQDSGTEDSIPTKETSLIRNDWNSAFHPKNDGDQHTRDAIGLFVLLSDQFVYLGDEAKSIEVPEDILKRFPKNREHRCCSGDEANQLIEDILACIPHGDTCKAGSFYTAANPNEKLPLLNGEA